MGLKSSIMLAFVLQINLKHDFKNNTLGPNFSDLCPTAYQSRNIVLHLYVVGPELYLFLSELKLREFVSFQALGVFFLVFGVCLLVLAGFLLILIRFLQHFKIVSLYHAQKEHRPKFQIYFEFFTIYHDFAMNIMGIKVEDAQTICRKKVSMGLILHIMCSKILLGYTDTVLGRRYTIRIQCFSTELLWH